MKVETKEWLLEVGEFPDMNSRRYKGRYLFEDKVIYVPTVKEPRVFTVVSLYSGEIRRKGKLSIDLAREQYPMAKSISYVNKSTGKLYQRIKLN